MTKSTASNKPRKKTSKRVKRTKKIFKGRPEYTSEAYKRFVREVKLRDENRCQFPGCRRYRYGIEVHHILPRSTNIALRYAVTNGICLCGGRKGHHTLVTGNEQHYAPLFLSIVQSNSLKQVYKSSEKEK